MACLNEKEKQELAPIQIHTQVKISKQSCGSIDQIKYVLCGNVELSWDNRSVGGLKTKVTLESIQNFQITLVNIHNSLFCVKLVKACFFFFFLAILLLLLCL
jgi:hypothetical protein